MIPKSGHRSSDRSSSTKEQSSFRCNGMIMRKYRFSRSAESSLISAFYETTFKPGVKECGLFQPKLRSAGAKAPCDEKVHACRCPKPLRTLGSNARASFWATCTLLLMHVVTPKPLRTFGRHALCYSCMSLPQNRSALLGGMHSATHACRYPKTAPHCWATCIICRPWPCCSGERAGCGS
jgi:hypothetical protein